MSFIYLGYFLRSNAKPFSHTEQITGFGHKFYRKKQRNL